MKASFQKFVHSFSYYFLSCTRNRSQLFWCLAFPIFLSSLFFFAFGNIGESERFSTIPVAVVIADRVPDDTADSARKVIESLCTSKEDGTAFLNASYVSADKAAALLTKNSITGILTLQENGSFLLTIGENGDSLSKSILKTFADEYDLQYALVLKVAQDHPENLPEVIASLDKSSNYISSVNHTGSLDESLSYFYNLIAMFCMYASMSGHMAVIKTHANLSDIGLRNTLTPVSHFIVLSGHLLASFCIQYTCIGLILAYDIAILGINFGTQLPYVLTVCAAGCLAGVSMGFCVGSVGRMTEQTKSALLTVIIMICSSLSGLFAGNSRIYIEHYLPVLNKINPTALISDSFYAMVICEDPQRMFENLRNLLLFSAVLFILGVFIERGKKYETL